MTHASVNIYGIKNCDTMKKALQWLDDHDIAYDFHDYKKTGADPAILTKALADHGWENVINRKGTSWRALTVKAKTTMNDKTAVQAAQDNPSLIRRPLLAYNGKTYLGFKPDEYAALFQKAGLMNNY